MKHILKMQFIIDEDRMLAEQNYDAVFVRTILISASKSKFLSRSWQCSFLLFGDAMSALIVATIWRTRRMLYKSCCGYRWRW